MFLAAVVVASSLACGAAEGAPETATGAAPAPAAGTSPSLRVVGSQPLRLRGGGFVGEEVVKLRVRAGTKEKRRVVHASGAGTFTVSFPALSARRCGGGLSVAAVGSRGSRASIELQQLDCQRPDMSQK